MSKRGVRREGTLLTAQLGGERGLLPEGAQTGLDATTTGVKYEGKVSQTVDDELVKNASEIRLEGVTVSSAGDETVAIEIYDETGAVVADSVSISGGGQASLDVMNSLTSGNTVHVRFNVTAASATTAATFDAVGARLVLV